MKEDNKIEIRYGILSDTLMSQIKSQGYKFDTKEIKRLESNRNCISELAWSGIITQCNAKKLFNKLHERVINHLNTKNKPKNND